MSQKIFIVFIVSFIQTVVPAFGEGIELWSRGTVEFKDSEGAKAANLLDGNPLEEFRTGINLQWDTWNGSNRRVPFSENGGPLSVERLSEDWTRVELEIRFPATQDLVEYSDGILLDAYVRSSVTQFWGEELVRVAAPESVSILPETERFHLILEQTDTPEVLHSKYSVVVGNMSKLEDLSEVMEISVRNFKIAGKKKYLNLHATALKRYLQKGWSLDVDKLWVLQEELPRHWRFSKLSHVEQANQLHQLALFLSGADNQTTIAGTNSANNRQAALALLNMLPSKALDETPHGEPLPESYQKAMALEMDIICKRDKYPCVEKMYEIQGIDLQHPFKAEHMWLMLSGYLDGLYKVSKNDRLESDEAFIERILSDELLSGDWALVNCILDQHGGPRSRSLKRQMRDRPKEYLWVKAIKSDGANC